MVGIKVRKDDTCTIIIITYLEVGEAEISASPTMLDGKIALSSIR